MNPGDENYYSPRQSNTTDSNPEGTADMVNFHNACTNGSIATSLEGLLPTAPTAEPPAGLTRTVARPDPNPTNLLRIAYTGTYGGSAVGTRVISLIPTAAKWCP